MLARGCKVCASIVLPPVTVSLASLMNCVLKSLSKKALDDAALFVAKHWVEGCVARTLYRSKQGAQVVRAVREILVYWDQWMVNSFVALAFHVLHPDDTIVFPCCVVGDYEAKEFDDLATNKVVGVMWKDKHYAAIVVEEKARTIRVYNGVGQNLRNCGQKWEEGKKLCGERKFRMCCLSGWGLRHCWGFISLSL